MTIFSGKWRKFYRRLGLFLLEEISSGRQGLTGGIDAVTHGG